MGHREDLLAGAKRCLLEKGYLRTTARDIVAASGTNLASIGYHYGSKEALLNRAMFEAIEEWGEELDRNMARLPADAGPTQRFERFWSVMIESFPSYRHLWAATFEVFAALEEMPELHAMIREATEEARRGWAQLFLGIDPTAEPRKAHVVGSFYYALMAGVMSQWLVDPDHAPSAADLTEALLTVTGAVRAGAAGGVPGEAAPA